MNELKNEPTLKKMAGMDPTFSPFNLIGPPMPMETWWRGPGWQMHWGNIKLNFHLAWHWLKRDSVKWRIFSRWIVYPQRLNPGGYQHKTLWLTDGLERICSVRCECGKVFAQKHSILPPVGSDEFKELLSKYSGTSVD